MRISNSEAISKNAPDADLQALYKDLQGNILKSHARPFVRLFFLEFTGSSDQVKTWIKENITPIVTSFEEQLAVTLSKKQDFESVPQVAQRALTVNEDPLFCNFLISSGGYEKLGLQVPQDGSFRGGMANRSGRDIPQSEWEDGYQQDIDALLLIANDKQTTIDQFATEIINDLQGIVRITAMESGEVIKGSADKEGLELEHFGFADGLSQPRFFTEDLEKEKNTNVPQNFANWNPFASLDLVLTKDPNGSAFVTGNSDDEFTADDDGDFSFGSYLVFRKLEQDVRGWNELIAELSTIHNIDPHWLGAMTVGRFQDGTPIELSGEPGMRPLNNNFNYDDDKQGMKCPFHAHIRKTNPREESARSENSASFGVDEKSERAHRIARRGIPYGRPVNVGEMPPGENVGLLFMCFQSDIRNQFEFMQNTWADNENFLNNIFNPSSGNNETGLDGVIGQPDTSSGSDPINQTWVKNRQEDGEPDPDKLEFHFSDFVTLKGGEYFFAPSLSSLKSL